MGSSLDGTEVSDATDFPVFADARLQSIAAASDACASRSTQGEANKTNVGAGSPLVGSQLSVAEQENILRSELTKRSDWPQRVFHNLSDFLHALTPDGRMMYVSPSCTSLTGWEPADLIGHSIIEFVHPDDVGVFVEELKASTTSGNPLRFFYRFRKSDGAWAIFEAHGHPHLNSARTTFGSPNEPSCCGFFMVARPYPTKNAALLDSFLEQKIVNERLMRRLAELRNEEQQERDEKWQSTSGPATTTTSSKSRDLQSRSRSEKSFAQMGSLTASMNDKMWTYERTNHIETIEMLTGLRYKDGERSQGISAGDVSPQLIMSDAGIQAQPGRKARGFSGKEKRVRFAGTRICGHCGTLDSPEWRKGPDGFKTLCNACGCKSTEVVVE
jgi:PAS domain S-box-containing protein